jgi:hypothetical protein
MRAITPGTLCNVCGSFVLVLQTNKITGVATDVWFCKVLNARSTITHRNLLRIDVVSWAT